MYRIAFKLFALLGLVAAGAGVFYLEQQKGYKAQYERAQLRIAELEEVAKRLQFEKRVADVIVIDQKTGPDRVQETTLLFVEYGRDGKTPLPAKRVTYRGDKGYIDAQLVKFQGKYVEGNDPLRGHSLALFTRVFGDKQVPATGDRLDDPGKIPAFYKDADPRVSEFEQTLWKDFWRLADDKAYREAMGVDVVQGNSVYFPFKRGKLYTITVQSNGGVLLHEEDFKGVFAEALKPPAPAEVK